MNFGTLKSRVASYLHRDDLTSIIPDFVNAAMHRLERNHNWNCMKTKTTGSTTDDYISLPTRYKDTDSLFVIANSQYYPLTKSSYSHMISIYPEGSSSKDRPEVFATLIGDSKFYLRPYPDAAYSYELIYYAYTADLSADTDTNWWTNNTWELLLYGALIEAEPYVINDERMLTWKALYDNILGDLSMAEENEVFSGIQQIRGTVP